MLTPAEVFKTVKTHLKREWKIAFLSAFLIGLAVHLPAMISDIPNHDGLGSMYFNQNMITSGRWFLTVACGFSSYFTLPWLIGLLSLLFLSCTAAALTELLELKTTWTIVLTGALLVSFPAVASTFAYIFTMDGYMLALLLSVLSVLFTKKSRLGFLPGAVCLALSMGTYQAYLPFSVLLCIYCIVIRLAEDGEVKDKIKAVLHYLYMGILGSGLYLVMLYLLLAIQGKQLDSYQGINGGLTGGAAQKEGLFTVIRTMYADFATFTIKGNVLYNNLFSVLAWILLLLSLCGAVAGMAALRKWWKKPAFFVIIGLLAVGLPLATNVILLISPEVNYHLLMRYQWVVYPILILAFLEYYGRQGKRTGVLQWCALCAAFVLAFNYGVTDNIGYSNLQKRYEKTYAYCVRLLDRIEQTPGYYQGIPVAVLGVVGTDEYPVTDITEDVTGGMIGLSGDSLLYTGANYQAFMKNYLGATLNFVDEETMGKIYFSEEYMEMDSFPGPESTKVVDGILYVRTENIGRD